MFYENNTNGFINLLFKEGITPVELNRQIPKINEIEAIERWATNNRFLLSLNRLVLAPPLTRYTQWSFCYF